MITSIVYILKTYFFLLSFILFFSDLLCPLFMHTFWNLVISIYIYIERERERGGGSNNNKNQEVCVTLVLSPVCNASSKADTVEKPPT